MNLAEKLWLYITLTDITKAQNIKKGETKMGYRSSVRILIPNEEYKKLKNECLNKYGDGSYFNYLDREEVRTSSNSKEYAYFGWDWIKWYTNMNDDFYEELDFIEERLSVIDDYQKVRIGESNEDIEEDWCLKDSSVDSIQIIREFDENQKNKIDGFELYMLCNKEQLFTCGSIEQYQKMFDIAKNGVTQTELAYMLYLCSSQSLDKINEITEQLFKKKQCLKGKGVNDAKEDN